MILINDRIEANREIVKFNFVSSNPNVEESIGDNRNNIRGLL